jgi:hypothetical protein
MLRIDLLAERAQLGGRMERVGRFGIISAASARAVRVDVERPLITREGLSVNAPSRCSGIRVVVFAASALPAVCSAVKAVRDGPLTWPAPGRRPRSR